MNWNKFFRIGCGESRTLLEGSSSLHATMLHTPRWMHDVCPVIEKSPCSVLKFKRSDTQYWDLVHSPLLNFQIGRLPQVRMVRLHALRHSLLRNLSRGQKGTLVGTSA